MLSAFTLEVFSALFPKTMFQKLKIGMSYRFMRVVVMFDLPVETSSERRNYRLFRKFLINEGFIMMQESIYTKICINAHAVDKVENNVIKHKPAKGIVQLMVVTERQFAGMKLVVGEPNTDAVDTDERLVILWSDFPVHF